MDKQYDTKPFQAAEPDDYSYADPEFSDDDDLSGQEQAGREKSPERKLREAEFQALYQAYMRPTEKLSDFRVQCQQDDLYMLLCQLNHGWACRKAAGYKAAGFTRANAEDALYIGCYYAYNKLLEDKANGHFLDYPVAHYLRIAQYKSIDGYFRKEFGRLTTKKGNNGEPHRRKEPYFVSIDAMNRDNDGNYHSDRNVELSYSPFDPTLRSSQERHEMAGRLVLMFISELLNYSREPQKPLAVMFGNILFQLAKFRGTDEISRAAKASTKTFSPAWAHTRMGSRTLLELGDFSEQSLRRFFSKPMLWGPAFRYSLQQRSPTGNGLWGDVVYTETYTEAQTSNWIESITKTINQKCAHQAVQNPEMLEFAEETFRCRNKFRQALRKVEKEAER